MLAGMAHPPPPKPAVPTPVDQAALDETRAAELERHVDAWMKGQGKLWWEGLHSAPSGVAEIPIGERDSIRPEVLKLLCDRYVKAGWSKATTAQDVPGEEIKGDNGDAVGKTAARPDLRGIVLTLVP